jgi:hypothetical protein
MLISCAMFGYNWVAGRKFKDIALAIWEIGFFLAPIPYKENGCQTINF